MAEEKIRLTTTEARAGSRGTQVRTVMIASLVLIVLAFGLIYAFYG